MPEELDPGTVKKIINLWLAGGTTQQIADDLKLSGKSVVSKKVRQERERTPGLDDFKKLNALLIANSVKVLEYVRAANILNQMEKEGVELGTEGIKDALELVKRYRDKTQEVINDLKRVRDLEEKHKGKLIEKIREEFTALQIDLDVAQRRKKDLGEEIEKLEDRLGEVKEYEKLKNHLDNLLIGPQAVNGFVTYHKQLLELNFTQDYAVTLATALKTKKYLPKDAADLLTEALEDYNTLDEAVSELRKQKQRLDDQLGPLREKKEFMDDHVRELQLHLIELRKTEKSLNESIKRLEMAEKTALKDAPGSLKTIIAETIREIDKARGRARKKLNDAIDSMNKKVDKSAEKFSNAAAEVATKAANADKTMDSLTQEAYNLGLEIAGLDPIGKAYRFMSEGKGDPKDVIPWAITFNEQLEKWEREKFGEYKTTRLQDVIKEMKQNWANSKKG